MKEKKHFFDDEKNVTLIMRLLFAGSAILVLLDFVVDRKIYYPLEQIPAFYPLYGFIGCVLLVVVAKWMRIWLMRSEDYYQNLKQKQEQSDNNTTQQQGGDDHVAS